MSPAGREGGPLAQPLAAADYYRLGRRHLERGTLRDNEAAQAHFRRVLSAEPNHAGARVGLARALAVRVSRFGHDQSLLAEAFDNVRRGVALAAESAEAHLVLGDLEQISGRLKRALPHYRTAARLDPDNVRILTRIGNLHYRRREFSAALHWLDRAYELAPLEAGTAARLGEIHLQLDDLDRAARWLERASELEPLEGSYRAELGTAYFLQGNREKATEPCRALLDTLPSEVKCTLKLGELALLDLDLEAAQERFERLVELEPQTPYFQCRLAQVLLARGRQEGEALLGQTEHLLAGRDVSGYTWSDNWVMAALHSLRGEVPEASVWLDRLSESGRLLYRWDRLDPAFESLRGSAGFQRYLASMRSQVVDLRRQAASSI